MEWLVVVFVRLLIPLFILKNPLWGSIAAVIADNFDVIILDSLGVTDYSLYNPLDKGLDMYMYLIQGYTILFWKNKFAKKIGLGLLGYRLVGFILYEFIQWRPLLFIFPNVFIFYYMYYVIYQAVFHKDPFKKPTPTFIVLTILTLLKLGQEYMLYVAQFPIYQLIKGTIFPFI